MPGSSRGLAPSGAHPAVKDDALPTRETAREAATILIVEDDPGAVETFEQILKLNGYGVRVAADAESGLLEVRRLAPSAVLLDLHLPMGDGVEFLRQLRGSVSHARMPIAVVTGDYFVEDGVARELQTLGARVHFKPLWEEDLLKLIHDLLDS
jgi:DNA-binding response OmpR family regulator